jgi:hypothetical protein
MTRTVAVAPAANDLKPPAHPPASRWLSLLASLLFHCTVYLTALYFLPGMRGYGDGSLVKGSGDASLSGAFVMSPPGGGGSDSNKIDAPADEPAQAASTFLTKDSKEPDSFAKAFDEPPIALPTPLPEPGTSVVDAAPPASVAMPPDLTGVSKSASRRGARGTGPGSGGGSGGGAGTGIGTAEGPGGGTGGGLGPGETRFFNIREKGLRYVYVIDRSVSMTSHNAIRVAKAELMSSLQSLNSDQQFQVIFYNVNPTVMHLGGDAKDELYWASELNRTMARQFIGGMTPELGTDHLPALRKALELKPDVIYFLSDAGQPHLDRADREKIRLQNGGRTRIHCIEFGTGADLTDERSFMEKLATENGGRYVYRDISEFTK